MCLMSDGSDGIFACRVQRRSERNRDETAGMVDMRIVLRVRETTARGVQPVAWPALCPSFQLS
jgi:hypothetical protein